MNFTTDQLRAALPPDLFARVQAQLGQPRQGPPPAKRRNKYGAVRTFALGRWWPSTKEARYAENLALSQRAGELAFWHAHSLWHLEGGWYELDFEEWWKGENQPRFVDVKGGKATQTKLYRMKKRAILDRYGVTITEV